MSTPALLHPHRTTLAVRWNPERRCWQYWAIGAARWTGTRLRDTDALQLIRMSMSAMSFISWRSTWAEPEVTE